LTVVLGIASSGSLVWVFGFRVRASGIRVWGSRGLGFGLQELGFGVFGFRVRASGIRVWGSRGWGFGLVLLGIIVFRN